MTSIELPYIHAFLDRHGRARYYFRHKGKRWPLPSPGDPGFMAAYEACKARIANPPQAPARVAFLPGSLGWAIEKFLASDDFSNRAKATKAQDRRLLDELKRHAGAGLLRDLRDRHVKAIRDNFRTAFSTSVADATIAKLSVIWAFADEYLQIENLGSNPTVGIRRVHTVKTERQPWPEHVMRAFDDNAIPQMRLAKALVLYTGQRRSDVVKMKWDDLTDDGIKVKQQKTGEELLIPCHRQLRELLGRTKRTSEFILVGERGKPLSGDALYEALKKVLRRAGITGYSVHGLRKNAGVALADAGCDVRQIMAILGHRTFSMAMHYTKKSDQKRHARAAIEKWEEAEKSGKPRNIRASR
jgi:integrase